MTRKAWLIALCLLLALAAAIAVWAWLPEPAPVQPIAFNHKLHMDQKMGCTNCHQLADKAARSGLPTANLCMACHQAIKADSPEVKKIAQYRDRREPIPWARIYQLPDFVYFNHVRHVQSGIACSVCHGLTGTVPVSRQERNLEMDFCVECHTARHAPTDCATCHQ